ncbi:hypothetical protein [Kineococcus arenarius]|uniref:hypothetical protein n=1 Tax=Kineococcus sp. SYSU DK007 TaxID=3383128 RepID=UPI003D7E6EB0
MNASVQQRWPRPEDERWGDRLRGRLLLEHGVPAPVAEEAAEEARLACWESGRGAEELFGPADEHAAEVARERVPVERRAAVDLDGGSPRDRWTLCLLGAGWGGCLGGVLLLVTQGWTTPLTPAALAVLAATAAGWTGAAWGVLERRDGRLGRGWAWVAAGAAGVVAGAAAADALRGRPALGELPVPLVLLASAALVVAGLKLPQRPAALDARAATGDPEEWFERLAGVLRGRFHLTRGDVRERVEEARGYWRDSGSAHPRDEFGAPEVHALRLVEGSDEPRRRRSRLKAWLYGALTLYWGATVVDTVLGEGFGGELLWRAAAVALTASLLVGAWRGSRAGAPAAGS